MKRTPVVIILALIALLLIVLYPRGEDSWHSTAQDERTATGSAAAPRSSDPHKTLATTGKSSSSLEPLDKMLPARARILKGDLSSSQTNEKVILEFDGVRIEAAGARSHRNGVMLEAPYQMIGLDGTRTDWTSNCEVGYVYLEKSGENMVTEGVLSTTINIEGIVPVPVDLPIVIAE